MNFRHASAFAVAGLALVASAGSMRADEINLWPFSVDRQDAATGGTIHSGLGPFEFSSTSPDGLATSGFRPLWDEVRDTNTGQQLSGSFIYPLAHWEMDPSTQNRNWTIFNLVNFSQNAADNITGFDIWPLYFSRETGEKATSYQAMMPIYGEVIQRFNQDRLKWVLFPLYGRFEKAGVTTTTTPWPFVKTVSGEGHRGFEIWPLGGHREQTGVSRDPFALWPLLYRQASKLDTDSPSLKTGFLPFYALDQSPGYRSETYLWPLFGYVDRTAPYQYHARHFLWPLWVQGRGDDRHINRWAPFYSHSRIKDHDKTWVLWPLWRQATWNDPKLRHERRQLLYFIFNETTQHDRANPDLKPARKTHLWPLFSSWDNGAGQKQVQAFSPLEIFLPHQDRTRRLWSPLFSIYRFDQSAPGETRQSLLWDAVTYSRSEERNTRQFNLGPLVSYQSQTTGERIRFFAGVFGFQRTSAQRVWRPYFGRAKSFPSASTP